MLARISYLRRSQSIVLTALLLAFFGGLVIPGFAAPANGKILAATPPMGWNDWAHYECNINAQIVLANAGALVKSGLAARGYNTVTIDDCWMQKDRDAHGDLQVDPQRFPQGMEAIGQAIHAMGLKFGIYEDSGYETCGKFAGSGVPDGGGKDHFLQDARLFSSWGVDYLKLDGCNLYIPAGSSNVEIYRDAYAAESAALKIVGRPIIFSESAPAYFQRTPDDWYDVLSWVGLYGQLWREGSDIATFRTSDPDNPRFRSVLWNYSYNLPLGRFQKPGNWNDSDFIIGGDAGMSLPETRSQVALWSMMSAPLILSSDLEKLSPQAIAILGNKSILAVDQDRLGKMATLVRRSPVMDVLFKPLSGGDDAVAVLNHGDSPIQVNLRPTDFGFSAKMDCSLAVQNLWDGMHASTLQANIASHDTAIWRIHPSLSCGRPTRTGAIVMVATEGWHRDVQDMLGKTATLVQHSPGADVLFKELPRGNYVVAVQNRGSSSIQVNLLPKDFGFSANSECSLNARNFANAMRQAPTPNLQADVASDATAIWRIHPSPACGLPTHIGTIITLPTGNRSNIVGDYGRCLSASGSVGDCAGTSAETWTITPEGALKSVGGCLVVVDGKPAMQECSARSAQSWKYTLVGNLIAVGGDCLTANGPDSQTQSLTLQPCGHNQPDQTWSLPN